MKYIIIILSIFLLSSCGIFKTAKDLLKPSEEVSEQITPKQERKVLKRAKKAAKKALPKLTRKQKKASKRLNQAVNLDPSLSQGDSILIYRTDTVAIKMTETIKEAT
mgnify:CR=1 FL=1